MYNYCQPVIASSVAVLWGMDQFGWLKRSPSCWSSRASSW